MNFIENLKNNKSLIPLIILSILILPSIFFGSKAAGVVLLLYILTVFWNMTSLMGIDIFGKMKSYTEKVSEDSFKEKEYLKSAVYGLVFPMTIIGALTMIGIIYTMIFLM